jgi:AAA+ ATPase superfamily predicted ATPase
LCPKDAPRTSVVYRIADPLLRFWFRFVEPNISSLPGLTPTQAFEQLVAPQWESFCGEGFERLCRDALPLLYRRDGIRRFRVGEYWDRDTQIDVVGLRSDGWVDLGECRWPAGVSAAEALRDITARAVRYPADGRTVARHLFLRSVQRTVREEVGVHDLQELYHLPTTGPGR